MRRGRGVLPRPRGRAEGRSWPVAATHSLRQRTCSSSHHSSATNDLRMMMVSLEFKIFEWFHLICMARATTRGGGQGRSSLPVPGRWLLPPAAAPQVWPQGYGKAIHNADSHYM